MSDTHAIQCTVAPHEADMCPLNIRGQFEFVDQEQINTRRLKTRATHGHEVGDRLWGDLAIAERP